MKHESNLTVLGMAPMWKTLPAVGVVLVALFVMMKPESTAGLAFMQRAAFWTLHIGLGLVSIGLASLLIRRLSRRVMPTWLGILLTGIVGAVVLAPTYLWLESWFPGLASEPPDGWLDTLAQSGPLAAMLAEFFEVAPVYVATWFAVNLPLLFQDYGRSSTSSGGSDHPPGKSELSGDGGDPSDGAEDSFLSQLPRAIGKNVVAISSDMHYLHVYTVKGKCMILGSLRDAAAALQGTGMQVHRSHWIAHDHVTRLIRDGSQWQCLMSNDLRIPVSRRKRSQVIEWHGNQARVVSLQSSAQKKVSSGR
jgi:hypothetical protein